MHQTGLVMPTPPRRPSNRGRAKSTPHNGKPVDIGQPLGVHDINSVREKVRRWQQQGGGVITENDVGPESDSSPESGTGKQNSPTTKKHSRTKEGSKNKENNVQRARSNSTPRKRVISDEHWRKNRSPPASLPQKVTHKRRTDVFDRYGKSTSTTKEKEKTCGHSGGTNPSSNPLPGDGIRVYATSVSSSRRSERPKSRHTCGSQSIVETEVESSVGDQTSAFKRQQQSQPRKKKGHDYGARDVHLRKRPGDDEWSTEPSEVIEFSEQENRSRRQTHKLPPRTLRPPKGGIFNHVIDESKKFFGKHEPLSSPVPAPRNHGSNVEAWLSSTPDPFTEDEDLLSSAVASGFTVTEKVPSKAIMWTTLAVSGLYCKQKVRKGDEGQKEIKGTRKARLRQKGGQDLTTVEYPTMSSSVKYRETPENLRHQP
ncbi:predicted protein [Histoplasma mississippiense (nom. inval.)]|uniref:predicted protein n=1 Tax=Ajellomyces capsulatus (strain NAm1 / WU24) TaxID=2059318 RepID=UPI000157C913|nr:predicted protein [Histoplasma mississippiense (nom. inval.)]EDN09654.1 predicted protein [Histoplasma mississippiense (nom. inval.)]